VAGAFITFGDRRRVAVARLYPDGEVDPSFDAGLDAMIGLAGRSAIRLPYNRTARFCWPVYPFHFGANLNPGWCGSAAAICWRSVESNLAQVECGSFGSICPRAKQASLKALRILPIGAPFHCRWMPRASTSSRRLESDRAISGSAIPEKPERMHVLTRFYRCRWATASPINGDYLGGR